MPRFLTGLLTGEVDHYAWFPVRAASWTAALVSGTQNWSLHSYPREDGSEEAGPDLEVAIEARGRAQAERALSLIAAALVVIDGTNLLSVDLDLVEASRLKNKPGRGPARGMQRSAIPEACLVAARASWRLQRSYALAKLYLSMLTYSTHAMDLHPIQADPLQKSSDPIVHARLTQAIVLAYAALEELGLEVRASKTMPSSINGKWNPPVLADLEKRLRAAGLDPYESVLWDVRGPKTALETARPPKARSRAPWTRWPNVRDVNVSLVDAIAHVSWLRSSVAAHGGKRKLVRVLSAYDVANAQHVARTILLSTHGIFRIWFPKRPRAPKSSAATTSNP